MQSQAGADAIDLEALEVAVKAKMMDLGSALLSAHINADRRDGDADQLRCQCGAQAKRCGRRERNLISALGVLRLKRSYYHCDACSGGFFPKDRQLGIERQSVSQAVQRMIGRTAAEVSFGVTQVLLGLLAQVGVSVKQVERVAESLGRQISLHEYANADREPCTARTMYLGMDGTGVPVIPKETKGRKGKQADGSAKTREVKLIVIWTAERFDKKGRPRTDPGSVSYNAAIETASTKGKDAVLSPFAQRVYREALRRGFYQAPRQVVIGDGARWIWQISAEMFPEAIEVVDIYHAKEKLHDVGKAIYGADTDLAAQWVELRCEQLEAGDIEALIRELKKASAGCGLAATAVGYFRTNIERMRYAQFRAEGICVSSGVVEAGCKDAIGARLKRSGMRWSVQGANDIAALRCYVKSDRFDDYWYDRAINLQAK